MEAIIINEMTQKDGKTLLQELNQEYDQLISLFKNFLVSEVHPDWPTIIWKNYKPNGNMTIGEKCG